MGAPTGGQGSIIMGIFAIDSSGLHISIRLEGLRWWTMLRLLLTVMLLCCISLAVWADKYCPACGKRKHYTDRMQECPIHHLRLIPFPKPAVTKPKIYKQRPDPAVERERSQREAKSRALAAHRRAMDLRKRLTAQLITELGKSTNGWYEERRADSQLTERVVLLVRQGADVHASSEDGWTVLHQVAADGRADFVRFCLRQGARVNARDREGRTPLHWAVASGHVDCIRALLAAGADVNAREVDGWTPLHVALYLRLDDADAVLRAAGGVD